MRLVLRRSLPRNARNEEMRRLAEGPGTGDRKRARTGKRGRETHQAYGSRCGETQALHLRILACCPLLIITLDIAPQAPTMEDPRRSMPRTGISGVLGTNRNSSRDQKHARNQERNTRCEVHQVSIFSSESSSSVDYPPAPTNTGSSQQGEMKFSAR